MNVQSVLDDTLGALLAGEGNLLARLSQAAGVVRCDSGSILLGGGGDMRGGSSEGEDGGARSRCGRVKAVSISHIAPIE